MRRLPDEDLVEIANGDAVSRAHAARAEFQRRAIVRNMMAFCLTVMVALLIGIAFVDVVVST